VSASTSKTPLDVYMRALRASDIREKTEHTDRDAIKALVQSIAPKGVQVVHEAKGVRGKGTPDFKVRQNGQIIGYIEAKPIGTEMDGLATLLESEQIKKYRSLKENILLTDYLNWIWIKDGDVHRETLGATDDLLGRNRNIDDDRAEKVFALFRGFLSVPPKSISTARALADELAGRTRLLRDFLSEELARQEHEQEGERLYGLYLAFKRQVSESIQIADFADAFAQTLSYGLFLSKLNANGYSLHLDNAKQFIPKSFRLIQELVGFLDDLESDDYRDVKWVIDQILSVTNGVDVASLKNDLSFRNRKRSSWALTAKNEEEWRLFSRDPFVYFYEYFLARYDAELRRKRGVYYTPPPIVNFIVRGVDDILRKEFQLDLGMADSRVTALEFACGTGTFVIEMMQRAIENAGSSAAKIELLLKEHILKNIYAFEYLIAPYTIAHLKVAQYLEERQIRISDSERFNIFLTNTLEPIDPQPDYFVPALSEETKRATTVKKKPILVITGNPPYAGESKNKGPWITKALDEYKFLSYRDNNNAMRREPVQEKNLKWLHDDYVKFIRFAQMKMDATGLHPVWMTPA
jgi:N-6 DNA Methylase